MYTLEELKQRLANSDIGFGLYGGVKFDGKFVTSFTISRLIGFDVILFSYIWDDRLQEYISYFI